MLDEAGTSVAINWQFDVSTYYFHNNFCKNGLLSIQNFPEIAQMFVTNFLKSIRDAQAGL